CDPVAARRPAHLHARGRGIQPGDHLLQLAGSGRHLDSALRDHRRRGLDCDARGRRRQAQGDLPMSTNRFERWALGAWTVAISIFMLGPLAVMFAISVTAEGYISLPYNGVSLRWYADMLRQRVFLD